MADLIPGELCRIVEFLNKQMRPAEVLAVEVRQYVGQGLRVLVPSVIGLTEQAQQMKAAGSRVDAKWDVDSFLAELGDQRYDDEFKSGRQLIGWTLSHGFVLGFGRGAASFQPKLAESGACLFFLAAKGLITIPFGSLHKNPPFTEEAHRRELCNRLNEIGGVNIAATGWPSFPLSALTDQSALQRFIDVISWAASAINRDTASLRG